MKTERKQSDKGKPLEERLAEVRTLTATLLPGCIDGSDMKKLMDELWEEDKGDFSKTDLA
jgi:hypothetical protein